MPSNNLFACANCNALCDNIDGLEDRIRELEAEVERLSTNLSRANESCGEWADLHEAAEAKLAAIEGLARYEMTALEYGLVEAYDSENGVCADKPDECEWIKASDVHAILRRTES